MIHDVKKKNHKTLTLKLTVSVFRMLHKTKSEMSEGKLVPKQTLP